MKNIILVTILPGLHTTHDSLLIFKTVKYEKWLIINKNWQRHTGQINNVISDLHMISLQYKDVLQDQNLIVFSGKNWNDLGSDLIQTNFYVHLGLNMYSTKNLQARSASDDIIAKISDLSRWNNNCCRLRMKDISRSFILEPTEILNYKKLQLASEKSNFFTVNAIENFNLLVQAKNKTN